MAASNSDRKGCLGFPQNWPDDDRKRRQAGVRAAMYLVKKGQTVPAEQVETWIESWGTPHELPMPEPRRR